MLALPEVIDLPYVVAGQGGSEISATIENSGDADAELELSLNGSARFSLANAPSVAPAHARVTVDVRYEGAAVESIDRATLAVASGADTHSISVFGVAGSPELEAATWTELRVAQDVLAGIGATTALPTAPFPDSSASFSDSSVRIFIPEGYRDLGEHDFVLHFHGWNTTLAATLAAHRYQEHVWASGANTILVVPQGPVNASSGNFGKLMQSSGTLALLRDVLVVLYRDRRVTHPVLGEVVLTSHSGGYQAVAANLDGDVPVREVHLFDSLYGYLSTFETFVLAGGRLRSNYTSGGGTLDNNRTVAGELEQQGMTVAAEWSHRALLESSAAIAFAETSHDHSTRIEGAYGESLRWSARHGRHGPRIELRSAIAADGAATVTWLSPFDADVAAFVVETSADGVTWAPAARAGAADDRATFAFQGGARVRVRAEVARLPQADLLPSNVFRIDDGARVLVVQHFDRLLGGGYGGLSHDFAARVGEAAGGAATIDHRAIGEDAFELGGWDAVIWLLGDQSVDDRTFTPDEQAAVRAYLMNGGHLVVSGSEVGYELAGLGTASSFFSDQLGATYVADDSASYSISGAGPLAALASFTFAGANAPYAVDYPDVLGAASGGTVVLRYADGRGAAAGFAGQTVVAGFPLETIDRDEDRIAVTQALLGFAGY